jgi:8-oxo-dGTP diphosphatase
MFIVNVEGAIIKDGKWLVIERSAKEEHAGGLLSLVGGTVENEENSRDLLENTLKREIFEEVGVVIKDDVRFVGNSTFTIEGGREVLDNVFLCEIETGEPFVKSPDEVEAVHWMTSEEIYSHFKSPIWLKGSIQQSEALLMKNEHGIRTP